MENYSSQTLDLMFKRQDENHQTLLTTVKEGFTMVTTRQDIANGRIKKNELKIAMAMGGIIVLSMFAVPVLGWALYTLVNLPQTISETVTMDIQTALTPYVVPAK